MINMFNIIRNKVQLFGLLHKYYLCVVKQSKEKLIRRPHAPLIWPDYRLQTVNNRIDIFKRFNRNGDKTIKT